MADTREAEAFIPSAKEGDSDEYTESSRPVAAWRHCYGANKAIASILSAAGVVVTIIVLLFVFSPVKTSHAGHKESSAALAGPTLQGQEDCGQSPGEARKLGCIFDPVLLGWVPYRCHDAQLSADFLRRHGKNGKEEWAFNTVANGTADTALSFSELVDSGDFNEVYAEFAFLLLHCSFTRRKVQRAAVLGEITDGYTADPHQSAHCEMWTMWRNELDDMSTTVYNKYATCPRTHRNVGRYGWYRMINGHKVYRQDT